MKSKLCGDGLWLHLAGLATAVLALDGRLLDHSLLSTPQHHVERALIRSIDQAHY